MTTQREIWDAWTPPETLKDCVKLFFEIMDRKEYSEGSDREFHPNRMNVENRTIDSCRVWDTHRLNRILKKMKELSIEVP